MAEDKQVFLVFGKSCNCDGMSFLIGVFDDEEKAVSACISRDHTVCILDVNVPCHDTDGSKLPGWYPALETKAEGLKRTARR